MNDYKNTHKYRIKFSPIEPYFFGDDQENFYRIWNKKNDKDKMVTPYYTVSKAMPSQTTIFGTLRYLGLKVINMGFNYSKDEIALNNEAVGSASFNLDSAEEQDFGKIISVSPLFLCDKDGKEYVPCMLDHNMASSFDEDAPYYSPLSEFIEVETNLGKRLIAKDYIEKKGRFLGFCGIEANDKGKYDVLPCFKDEDDNGIISFFEVPRNQKADQAYFKTKNCILDNDYSFCIYLETEVEISADETSFSEKIAHMGHNKSTFSVTYEKIETEAKDNKEKCLEEKIREMLIQTHHDSLPYAYALSDVFITSAQRKELINLCLYSNIDTIGYRKLSTNIANKELFNRISLDSKHYQLIKAGGFFIIKPECVDDFRKCISNPNCEKIGLNKIIVIDNK